MRFLSTRQVQTVNGNKYEIECHIVLPKEVKLKADKKDSDDDSSGDEDEGDKKEKKKNESKKRGALDLVQVLEAEGQLASKKPKTSSMKKAPGGGNKKK